MSLMRSMVYSRLDASRSWRHISGAVEILWNYSWLYLATGLCIQGAIGISVSLIQSLTICMGWHATTMDGPALLIVTVLGIPFNTGGALTRILFEFLAGFRTDVVMGRLDVYIPILCVQVCAFAALLGWRLRRTQRLSDQIFWAIVLGLTLNSLANLFWPWWGT